MLAFLSSGVTRACLNEMGNVPVVGGTGCRMTGTENFGDLILCEGREGREEYVWVEVGCG